MGKARRNRARRAQVAPRPKERRTSLLTRTRALTVAAVGAALAVALVGASLVSARGNDESRSVDSAQIVGSTHVEALLEGIPQRGAVLGEDDAAVTLVEYADLQCPFCAEWSLDAFPELVTEYVRDGRLRIEFRGLAFVGPESEDALRVALAAGEQGKLWNVVDLVYQNQGAENSGWVTDDFLRAVTAAVPGLDADRALRDRDSAAVTAGIDETSVSAKRSGITGTPSFLLGPTGGALAPIEISSLGPEEFRAAIDELLDK